MNTFQRTPQLFSIKSGLKSAKDLLRTLHGLIFKYTTKKTYFGVKKIFTYRYTRLDYLLHFQIYSTKKLLIIEKNGKANFSLKFIRLYSGIYKPIFTLFIRSIPFLNTLYIYYTGCWKIMFRSLQFYIECKNLSRIDLHKFLRELKSKIG